MYDLESLDRIYDDPSELKITSQQVAKLIQGLTNLQELKFGDDTDQLNIRILWLINHNLAPKSYPIKAMIILGEDHMDTFKQLDKVSNAEGGYSAIIDVEEDDNYEYCVSRGSCGDLSLYAEHFTEKGVIPTREELIRMIVYPDFVKTILIFVEKNLIVLDPKILERIRETDSEELIEMIQSLHPTKSSIKR